MLSLNSIELTNNMLFMSLDQYQLNTNCLVKHLKENYSKKYAKKKFELKVPKLI